MVGMSNDVPTFFVFICNLFAAQIVYIKVVFLAYELPLVCRVVQCCKLFPFYIQFFSYKKPF